MTTLLLVRHGETVDNVNKIMQGQTQGRLTQEGVRQAEALRERLRHEQVDAFVASDLRRAIDTCAIVAEPHGLPVVLTPLLRERDWGGFTGRYIPDLQGEVWPADIESLEALQERAARFLEWVKSTWPNKQVVAVGHGIINKAIQSVYHQRPMNQVLRMENAEVRELAL